MTRRPSTFLLSSVGAFFLVIAVWLTSLLYQPVPTVPVNQTATLEGVTWHLDFLRQVDPDDPAVTSSYMPSIDGATYLLLQFTRSSPDPLSVCFARVAGNGRQWAATGVFKPPEGISQSCSKETDATEQFVAVVPPSVVPEIHAVEVNVNGKWVRLEGRVT
ncbi:MAG: hypothetical protein FWD63_04235 [Propionibacteriaceae bacterium]|nr:hypothetical protein [Propionibacteriaceae bacterium]